MNGGSPIRHGLNRGLNWLRSLLYTTGSVLVLMVIALSAPFTLLLPQRLRARWLSLWATFNIVWLRLICGVAYTVRGLDQCPSGPVVS
ncbi:MAG: hypothetical protein J4A00_11165, partial [Gammaproteobacteria bacterium]|nr:hypothetical protein [Gammaproteobacteria bacterium]